MNKFDFLSKFFIIVSIFSLIFRRGIVKPYTIQPFEFFIIIAGLFFILSLIFKNTNNDRKEIIKFWIKLFLLFLLFLLLGSINSFIIYGTNLLLIKNIIIDFFTIGTQILIFLLIIYYGDNLKFRKNILLAFLTPLIFTPFIFMPNIAEKLTFLEYNNYFWGLHQNFATFASLIFITLLYLVIIFSKEKDNFLKFFYWIGIILTSSIILWSGSRSVWVAAIFSLLFIILFQSHQIIGIKKIKYFILIILLILISLSISYTLLPNSGKNSSIIRIFPQATNHTTLSAVIQNQPIQKSLTNIANNPKPSIPNQNRQSIWPQAIKLFVKNPFGLGTQYHKTSNNIIVVKKNWLGHDIIDFTVAHNNFLEIGLSGGVGALIIFLFLILKIIKITIKTINENFEWLILSSSMIGLFTITFFQGSLQGFPWFWIIMSLIITQGNQFNKSV